MNDGIATYKDDIIIENMTTDSFAFACEFTVLCSSFIAGELETPQTT